MLQQKTRKGGPSSRQAATATGQRTEVEPPHVTIDEFPPLEARSSALKRNSPARKSRSRSAAAGSTRNGRKASRSASRNEKQTITLRGRSPSARRVRNNDKSYAEATKKPKGYYADDDDEVKAWQTELRAIEARNQADADKCRRLETELLQLRQKIEEESRRREARKSTILGHIKTAIEARKTQQEQQRKQREQQADSPASRGRDPIREERTEGTATASSLTPQQPTGWQHKKEVQELLASQHNTVVYVDGATKGKEYAAGAVFYRGEGATPFEIATSCGLGTEVTSDTVEEAALLFTLGVYGHLPGKTRNLIIYTDSQEAVRNMYKLKATTSPTVHAFFDTALSVYREHGTRISVRWVPGHQEISGNDMAHAAAQCGMRIPQLPSQQASNCEESVEQPENTACYDPVEELRRCRKMRKIQLAEKWQPEDYPLPAKTFKRKETVQLRRIRTEGAVTPRLKYHINLSQLRRTQPYAVPPDPRCQRCKDPEAIPRLDHLLWECQALALCRVEAIETLPEEQRPKKLVDWTHPQGEAQRRTRILQSLLDFVAKSDLGDSI
ncbi:uncharacterized protein ISCGN_023415 [Ixodes scapularis]